MAQRRVVITGIGPVSAMGLGAQDNWQQLIKGQSALGKIEAFDPCGFDSQIAGEVRDFKIRNFVPKSYRKATKVMARDIELTVAAANLAAHDAGLVTKGTLADKQQAEPTYAPSRMGAHIGAGLIAVDLDELTAALSQAQEENGQFSLHKWGQEGMAHLTPLWLLKYLPNMLACHVTIIHDTHGPSNTITCGEASGALSIGESLRVIQRDAADMCFCGGAESKMNPMAFLRQQLTGRLTSAGNDNPAKAVKPFDQQASGTAVGEGGGVITLESLDTFNSRNSGTTAYGEVAGFGASQTVNLKAGNRQPEPDGRGIAVAIRSAMREANIKPTDIDLIVPFAGGIPDWDQAEAAALKTIFGQKLSSIPVTSFKAMIGNCGAGSSSIDVALAAKALQQQTLPPIINRESPIDGIGGGNSAPVPANLNYVLCCSAGFGGQNAALVLKKVEN